ncbi:MAG: hypothetical protein CTY36_01005 [Methylocystis sp.]|nr:MAG: hypothetical protein CTY36_01005 [Methylocystis sp.]
MLRLVDDAVATNAARRRGVTKAFGGKPDDNVEIAPRAALKNGDMAEWIIPDCEIPATSRDEAREYLEGALIDAK